MAMRGRPPGVKSFGPPIDEVNNDADPRPQPHEIDHAMDTLQAAESIKADKSMMRHVHQATGKKIKSLKSLKALAGKKSLEEQGIKD